MKDVNELIDDVAGLITGVDLDNVTNLNGAFERAARIMSQKADIPEASGRQMYTIYDGVYDYLAPEVIFGGAVTDFRPQGITRNANDTVQKFPIKKFDQTKVYYPDGANITFEWNKGVGIARVTQNKSQQRTIIDFMNDASKWTPGSGITTINDDPNIYYAEGGSLRFNVAASGYIEQTLQNQIDLSDYKGVGVVFLAIETQDATALTSIELRLGTSSTVYTALTETVGFLGAWQAGKFLLVAFDLSLSVDTATIPDFSVVDYVRLTINGTLTNFRVGQLFASLGTQWEMLYQSAAIFMNEAGVLSKRITNRNDTIILSDAGYEIYEHECAIAIITQNGGTLSDGMGKTYKKVLHGDKETGDVGLYKKFEGDNPSQEVRETGSYYEM